MLVRLLVAGLISLKEYIALHTITCLIPAFFLAGAMVSFVSKEAIIQYLGAAANKLRSFLLASVGSFFVAACSCTVIPVASGLYYQGGGVGPSFIFLWVAPAANVLALIYTGAILGHDMALLRVISALLMAFIVGSVMSGVFSKEEKQRSALPAANSSARKLVAGKDIVLLVLIVLSLLAPNYLIRKGPYLYKVLVWGILTIIVIVYALKVKTKVELLGWVRETWWVVRLIMPLLLAGVFIVGIIGAILPEAIIKQWLGGSSIGSSFFATLIGALSYFATLTEAPFVDTLISKGMGKGPALALLLTGPGLSLPNMLAVMKIFGLKKALVYIVTIVALGTICGFTVGNLLY